MVMVMMREGGVDEDRLTVRRSNDDSTQQPRPHLKREDELLNASTFE